MTLAALQRMTCEQLWAMKMWHTPEVMGKAKPEPFLGPADCRCIPWMESNNKFVSPFQYRVAAARQGVKA